MNIQYRFRVLLEAVKALVLQRVQWQIHSGGYAVELRYHDGTE